MPQGLQIFDKFGQVALDIGSTTTIYLGTHVMEGKSGSLTDTRINNRPCWVIVLGPVTPSSDLLECPKIVVSGNTISWGTGYYGNKNWIERMIFSYGVYG